MTTRFGIAHREWVGRRDGKDPIGLINKSLPQQHHGKGNMPIQFTKRFQSNCLRKACPQKNPEDRHNLWKRAAENIKAHHPNEDKTQDED